MKKSLIVIAGLCLSALIIQLAGAAEAPADEKKQDKPTVSISQKMDDVMVEEAARVKEELKQSARSLFERRPLGWDLQTLRYLYQWLLSLPKNLPELSKQLIAHSRELGFVGSLLLFIFLAALVYSLLGQKRVLFSIELRVKKFSFSEKLPETVYTYFKSLLNVVVSALIPFIFLGAFSLIQAMIKYQADWFRLTGQLLWLWAFGALAISLFREVLTRDIFKTTKKYGNTVFRMTRLIILFVLLGYAFFWAAETFELRQDVLAFIKFVISFSIVCISFLLTLKKRAILSLIPELPYSSYRRFVKWITRYYYPLVFFSFLTGLLWCLGYKQLGRTVLTKIWLTAIAFLLIMAVYHFLGGLLQKWRDKAEVSDEAAQLLIKSLKRLLTYTTITATLIIVLNLLGLLNPLQRLMSFPVFQVGDSTISFWVIIRAALIILAFVFGSRILQAYLDYKVYPSLGIETGLGYALNTFLKYLLIAIGFLIALNIVGIDLRFLLVFAGAIGIGIGLGLQTMAANVIAGFTIIFGGKIRKGDWIEVQKTIGKVTDIYLRATKVRTRDDIEYLVPNSELISGIIVNYSLSTSLIRIELPVGVSYDADPREVEKILLDVAGREPLISKAMKPAVRFVEYGDSSLNFQLLIWMDVKKHARRMVRSNLYFAIFDEFKKAGIEIPFPQRDLHVRSYPGKQSSTPD
jgi:small-conductance mechanosensitive channel